MSDQLALFEEKAKKRGMRLSSAAHYRDVQIAREIALNLCSLKREITIDDVRNRLGWMHPDITFGNWLGSVLRQPEFVPVGYVPTTHEGGHRRIVRLWRRA